MDVAQAVSILKGQQSKIQGLDMNNVKAWRVQTLSYVKDFFGEQSEEYKYLNQFSFYDWNSDYSENTQIKSRVPSITNFIIACQETLTNKGIHKIPKPNILFHIDNRWLITITAGLILGSVSIGYTFGKFMTDTDLKFRNKVLVDSLKRLSIGAPLQIPNKVPAANTDNNQTNERPDSAHAGKDTAN